MDRSFEAEKRFSGIIKSSDEEREWIANEHFNFLEAISCLYNNRLVSKFSREWCKDVVLNNLAAIQAMPWLHDTFIKSVTREDTYKELQVFLKKYKKEITSLANAHSNGVLNIDK